MSTENEIRGFIEEVTLLKDKYNIPAITGIIFKDGQFAPFEIKAKGKLILPADDHWCNEFYKSITSEAQRISGSQPKIIGLKS